MPDTNTIPPDITDTVESVVHSICNAQIQPPQPVQIIDTDTYIASHTNFDIGCNNNDEDNLLTPVTQPCDDKPTSDSLTLQEINSLLHLTTDTITKPFTDVDMEKYIQDYWSLSMQVQPDTQLRGTQMDGGANTNITNNKQLLKQFRYIQSTPVTGIGSDGPACTIKGEGFLDIQTNEGEWISTKTYYAPKCNGTIISPNAIVEEHPAYTSWIQNSHLDTGVATIYFYHKNQYHRRQSITMGKKNNLWYVKQPLMSTIKRAKPNWLNTIDINNKTTVCSMGSTPMYELWHQRLIHPGDKVMQHIHECVDGVPKVKRPDFHICDTCHESKGKHHKRHVTEPTPHRICEKFHMDYGFVAGKQNGNIIRSHDGFNSYLLITDAKSRYMWIFLCRNKSPPINTLKLFLAQYGLDNGPRIVRTDQGGELAKSHAIQEVIAKAGYALETTGADNSSQNGKVERPHQTLANMMRSALTDSGLSNRFWSDAIIHSVFIKNRLPHAMFHHKSTPYTELTGSKPNLNALRILLDHQLQPENQAAAQ